MKKLLTFVITMLLGASLAFAQASTSGSTDTPATATKTKKAKTKKAKTKKAKKGASGDTTAAPPK